MNHNERMNIEKVSFMLSQKQQQGYEKNNNNENAGARKYHINKPKYKKVGVLPVRIVWSNVSSIGPSSEAILSVLAVHRPFYISICISTLPTQYTTFI